MSDVDVPLEDKVAAEGEPEAAPVTETDYIEFVGDNPKYGVEFYNGPSGTHSLTAKHMKEYHDIDLGKKEVVWTKGKNGRMLVPVSDITPEAADVLAEDPMFKRVTLKN